MDITYLIIGFLFGVVFMLNRKEYKDSKTFEQLDEQIRKENAVNKALVDSLKSDLELCKQRTQFWKEKYENLSK